MSTRRALGVFVEGVYATVPTPEGPRLATNGNGAPFLRFVHEVGGHADRLIVFGRRATGERAADHPMPVPSELVALPHYRSLRDIRGLAGATVGSARAMWRGLDHVDTVWVFGPNPFGLLLVALARIRRRRIVLGVRQDSLAYFRSRLPSRRWLPALAPAWLLDRAFRLAARRLPVTVVGERLADAYGAPRPGVLSMTVTLIRDADIATGSRQALLRAPVRLLTVGRLDPEKNPFALIEAMHRLNTDHPGRYVLEWMGGGSLEDDVRRRVDELGLGDAVTLTGHVPFGPDLLARYRAADILVHVALTEGFPQVLMEALAAGLPIVATDVGGVRAGLDEGRLALMIPPADVSAIVDAVVRLDDDANLRSRLSAAGVARARALTLDAEAARVGAFVVPRADGAPGTDRTGDPRRPDGSPADDHR